MSDLKPIVLSNKIKKFTISINDEDYKLTFTPRKLDEEIKIKLIKNKNPLYTYKSIISLNEIKDDFSNIINNINDLMDYLTNAFKIKSYTNLIQDEGILFSIFPPKEKKLIPNIEFLLENSFSEKEIHQQKKQEETISLLKEEINLIKSNEEKLNNFLQNSQNQLNTIRIGLKFISSKYIYFPTSGEWIENFRANAIAILPNNSLITSHQSTINYIDKETKIKKIELKNAHQKLILSITIIDNENFITYSTDHIIKIWKIEDNQFIEKDKLIGHTQYVSKVLYLKDKTIISGSNDKTIRIWKNIEKKYQCVTSLITSNPIIALLNFNDRLFISGDKSNALNIYDSLI
jgi:WD40 repeat protein